MLKRTTTAAVIAALFQQPATALDLRSWDQTIDGPNQRYQVLESFNREAVLDRETQLVWMIRPLPESQVWAEAHHLCHMSEFAGRAGWRLPTISELSSLVGQDGTLPSDHPFELSNINSVFWSDTISPYSSSKGYVHRLQTAPGAAHILLFGRLSYGRVLCVRGPNSGG
jgi:hypothetical protein